MGSGGCYPMRGWKMEGFWEGQQHPPGSLWTTSTPEMISFNFVGWRRPGSIPWVEMHRDSQREGHGPSLL